MNLFLKFVLVFAIFGVLLSLIINIFSFQKPLYFLTNSLFFGLTSLLMGAGVFKIFELKVPEFTLLIEKVFDMIFNFTKSIKKNKSKNIKSSNDSLISKLENEINSDFSDNLNINSAIENFEKKDDSINNMSISENEMNDPKKNFGRHTIAEEGKIKQSPEVIAQAVRSIMSKDEE